MNEFNISPTDTYIVVNKSIITNEDRTILTMLYQPIIGPLPIILYFSFWSDLDKTEIMSIEYTHHHLITNMQISLNNILESRRKLEAIGLLKTYIKEGDMNNYIYQLYSPIKANDFFNHPILAVTLYDKLGKKEYDKLKNYFKTPNINTSEYKDITTPFSEVYSFTPRPFSEEDIRKKNTLKLNIDTNFDFEFLLDSLPKNLDKTRIFTDDIKELILQLSYLYGLDVIKMQDIIPICLTEQGTIDKENLRKTCRNYYQFDNQGLLPSIVYSHSQNNVANEPPSDNSKRSKMIYTFETISTYDLLKSKNNGAQPTTRDLKLAEDLIISYGLKMPVVNVLIDYILKTNNNKLTRPLAETIAGQWKRLNIETAEQAMKLAEQEHKKYKKQPINKPKIVKEEKIPDWFDKEIDKQQATIQEQEEMLNLLKEYQ